LDYALEVLGKIFTKKERADIEIRWLTIEEMMESAGLHENNRKAGNLLKGVFGITDGGRMPCAEYTGVDLQNAYYEGYTQSAGGKNLFVFNFKGEMIHAAANYPGCWHDEKSPWHLVFTTRSSRMH